MAKVEKNSEKTSNQISSITSREVQTMSTLAQEKIATKMSVLIKNNKDSLPIKIWHL